MIPYNIGNFLTSSQKTTLIKHINIAKADSPQKVLELAKASRDPSKTEAKQTAELVHKAKETVEKIVSIARKNPQALTTLDMKFVNVAVLSQRGKTFIP